MAIIVDLWIKLPIVQRIAIYWTKLIRTVKPAHEQPTTHNISKQIKGNTFNYTISSYLLRTFFPVLSNSSWISTVIIDGWIEWTFF